MYSDDGVYYNAHLINDCVNLLADNVVYTCAHFSDDNVYTCAHFSDDCVYTYAHLDS